MAPKVPPIKCQGIKTKLVELLKALSPQSFSGVWIEPFCGSCVLALNLLPPKAILADTNKHIIKLYRSIQSGEVTAGLVREHLLSEGKVLEKHGAKYYI